MEQMKRCTNCGKFPFCEEDGKYIDNCWIKREMKLDSKKDEVFDFSKVYNHIPRID